MISEETIKTVASLLQLNQKEILVLKTLIKGMTIKKSSRHLHMKTKLVEYYRKKFLINFVFITETL